MKSLALFVLLSLLAGCSATAWKDTGQSGSWCAPGVRGYVFYRTVDSFGAPNPQGRMALVGRSGVKESEFSFHHELDDYFGRCSFIKRWPSHGTTDSYPTHQSPFDLCMVSMNPTVIMGVERQNPDVSSLGPVTSWRCAFVGSSYLLDEIAIRTELPYHPGAKMVWFSPAVDFDLHQIDLTSGAACFTIGKNEQIGVVIDGAQVMTSRK